MCIILCAPFRTHVNDMLATLQFMDIRSRISYINGCTMYKTLNNMAPTYLQDFFNEVRSVHSVNTRSSEAGNLYVPRYNTYYGKSTFQYKGCVTWNVISKDIRHANSLSCFKTSLKKDLKL